MTNRSILLIDDDSDSACLVEHALRAVPGCGAVHHFNDGEQAARWYRIASPALRDATSIPAFALLTPRDGGRPGLHRFGGVSALRTAPVLRQLPVIVFGEAMDADACAAAYRHGADAVVHKPYDPCEMRSAVQQIATYWLLRGAAAEPLPE